MSNEAGDEATARFNFNGVNLPKCCQMVTQIKFIDIIAKSLQTQETVSKTGTYKKIRVKKLNLEGFD